MADATTAAYGQESDLVSGLFTENSGSTASTSLGIWTFGGPRTKSRTLGEDQRLTACLRGGTPLRPTGQRTITLGPSGTAVALPRRHCGTFSPRTLLQGAALAVKLTRTG